MSKVNTQGGFLKNILTSLFLLVFMNSCFDDTEKLKKDPEYPALEKVKSLKVSYGSCNHQNEPSPLWPMIKAEKSDIWIWLGDAIYADTREMSKMEVDFDVFKKSDYYIDFLKQTKYVWGTWDDHDYGENDAGKNYPMKIRSRELYLKFMDVPDNSVIRKRLGIYQSYAMDVNKKIVRFILLDTRYFRDEPSDEGDILGTEQWEWLENNFKMSADLFVIISSIQLIPNEHEYERWGKFPAAKEKFMDLVKKYQRGKNLLILSGDRHSGEVSTLATKTSTIYEITTSGMTHFMDGGNDVNSLRIGKPIYDYNYGTLEIDSDGNVKASVKGKDHKIFETIEFTL